MPFEDRAELAGRVLELLELTRLGGNITEDDVRALCERAQTPYGDVAAILVPPRYVMLAREILGKRSPIAVCTVANWPRGNSKVDYVAAEAEIAFFEGADEVNVTLPWRQVIRRDERTPVNMVEECVRMAGRKQCVKVTLEAGELQEERLVREAARVAIDYGAAFVETETGRQDRHCGLEQARVMLEEIRDNRRDAGFKINNLKTLDQCRDWLELIAEVLGEDWIDPDNVRIGGDKLLDEVLAALEEKAA